MLFAEVLVGRIGGGEGLDSESALVEGWGVGWMGSVSRGRRVEGCAIQGRGGSLGHHSCEPFGASGRAVADGVVEGEMMGFWILLELDTGRKRANVEDDFATTGYEGRLLWDDTGKLLDQRLLGTPVLRGNGLSRGLIVLMI